MMFVGLALPILSLLFADATSSHSQSSFAQLARDASQARDANRSGDAIRLYGEALKLQPNWEEGLWYLGTLLYQKESFADARDTLRRFVEREPKNGPGWTLLGMSEVQTREYTPALDHLQMGLALGLGDRKKMERSAYFFVGALLTRLGRFDESMDLILNRGQQEKPGPLFIESAGLAGLRMPLLPSEIPPGHHEMIRLAGTAIYAIAARRNDEAATLLKQLVTTYPNEPGVHFLYGAFLMDQSPDLGVEQMRREMEISPNSVIARIRLAAEYLKEDKLDAALPLARQAATLDPKFSATHLTLGELLLNQGDLPGAIRELETARGQSPDVLRIHWLLSRAYLAAGRNADSTREATQVERLKKLERKSADAL